MLLAVEGINDVELLRRISRMLHCRDSSLPDLEELDEAERAQEKWEGGTLATLLFDGRLDHFCRLLWLRARRGRCCSMPVGLSLVRCFTATVSLVTCAVVRALPLLGIGSCRSILE